MPLDASVLRIARLLRPGMKLGDLNIDTSTHAARTMACCRLQVTGNQSSKDGDDWRELADIVNRKLLASGHRLES